MGKVVACRDTRCRVTRGAASASHQRRPIDLKLVSLVLAMLATLSPRQLHQCQHRFARKPLHRHTASSAFGPPFILTELELATNRGGRMKTRGKYNGSYKMDLFKRRFPNHTEIAYREAVAKLKYLLAESYAPKMSITKPMTMSKRISKEHVPQIEEYADDEVQSVMSDVSKKEPQSTRSKYYASRMTNYPMTTNVFASSNDKVTLPPAELSSFIERQEEYIEQLEKESQYCREELKGLIDKVREVVAENEALQDRGKTNFFKNALDNHAQPYSEEPAALPTVRLSATSKRLEGPSIMFESRISELEAQLTQARVDLRKAREENQENLARMTDRRDEPQLQIELERASREKREFEAKLEESQRELARLKSRDTDVELRSKRAMEVAQQAEFEKVQAEVEVRRLREELERRQEKLRDALQETNRRIIEEKQQVERRFSQQMEQLSADVVSHWEAASKSHLEAEKQKREIAELKRDLSQKQTFIEDLKKELQQKTNKLQEELNAAIAEKDAAQEEAANLKLSVERNERQARQEQTRLQSEMSSYKTRLERADADLVHARRENLRLTEEIAALEKEINMNKIVEETRVGVLPSSKPEKTKEEKDKDKELAALIYDLESKHTSSAKTVADLEDSLSKQASLVSRLTAECQSLTQRLEANDREHKEEMASLQSKIEYLSSKIRESLEHKQQDMELVKAELGPNLTSTELVINLVQESSENSLPKKEYNVESDSKSQQQSDKQTDHGNIEDSKDATEPFSYPNQPIEELQYPKQENYDENYPNEHYTLNNHNQYDPAQYYEYYNDPQYTQNQDYPQDQQYTQNQDYSQEQQYAQAQEYSQDQQYAQSEQCPQNEQYLDKEILKDESHQQDHNNYPET